MFDFSRGQEITDEIIKLQNELKFEEAANLYLRTIKEIKSSAIRGHNDCEWISNLLHDQTIAILIQTN